MLNRFTRMDWIYMTTCKPAICKEKHVQWCNKTSKTEKKTHI